MQVEWCPVQGKQEGTLDEIRDSLLAVRAAISTEKEAEATQVRCHFACGDEAGISKLCALPCDYAVFLDEFFDTESFDLVKKNMWLRRRKGLEWNLRVCTSRDGDKVFFNDIRSEEEIVGRLRALGLQIRQLTDLRCFARIPTVRCTFDVPSLAVYFDICHFETKFYVVVGTIHLTNSAAQPGSSLQPGQQTTKLASYDEDLRDMRFNYPVRSKVLDFLGLKKEDIYTETQRLHYVLPDACYHRTHLFRKPKVDQAAVTRALCKSRDFVQDPEYIDTDAFDAHQRCYVAFGKKSTPNIDGDGSEAQDRTGSSEQ